MSIKNIDEFVKSLTEAGYKDVRILTVAPAQLDKNGKEIAPPRYDVLAEPAGFYHQVEAAPAPEGATGPATVVTTTRDPQFLRTQAAPKFGDDLRGRGVTFTKVEERAPRLIAIGAKIPAAWFDAPAAATPAPQEAKKA